MTDAVPTNEWPKPEDDAPARSNKRWYLLGAVAVLVGLYLTFFVVLGRSYSIPSESMSPSYPPGTRIWASRFGTVERGDVVVVPNAAEGPMAPPLSIRRVVALGGDEVTAVDGKLVVNGETVDEPYLAPGTQTVMTETIEVPDGQIFLLGDNRGVSFDSRASGPQPESSIEGYVRFSI